MLDESDVSFEYFLAREFSTTRSQVTQFYLGSEANYWEILRRYQVSFNFRDQWNKRSFLIGLYLAARSQLSDFKVVKKIFYTLIVSSTSWIYGFCTHLVCMKGID